MVNFINVYAALGLSMALLTSFRVYRAMFLGDFGAVKNEKHKSAVSSIKDHIYHLKKEAEELHWMALPLAATIVFVVYFIVTFALWPLFLLRKILTNANNGFFDSK